MANETRFKLSPDFADALAFAAHLHTGHRRKNSQIPYISHLIGVCSIVLEHDGTEDEAIAALLHDSIEDQAHRLGGGDQLRERIRRRFGDRVVEIIDGCTDAEGDPKPVWEERKEKYVQSIESATESVCLVIAADKLHNAHSILLDLHRIGMPIWDVFSRPRSKSLWYYRATTEALRKRLTGRGKFLVDELQRIVHELEEWKEENV